MNDKDKLRAIEVYLTWPHNTKKEAIDILDHIWYIVRESRYKPEELK